MRSLNNLLIWVLCVTFARKSESRKSSIKTKGQVSDLLSSGHLRDLCSTQHKNTFVNKSQKDGLTKSSGSNASCEAIINAVEEKQNQTVVQTALQEIRKVDMPQVMLDMGYMAKAVPAVCVVGTVAEAYTQLTDPVGEMIASRGFNLITGNLGGNMDAVRRAFFTSKNRKGKSLWTPSRRYKQDKTESYLPEFVDEALPEGQEQIDNADAVIALPGGPHVGKQIKEAIEKGKPVLGVVTDDGVKSADGKFEVNAIVKKEAPESVFLVDIKKVEEFLDKIKSSAEGKTSKDSKSHAASVQGGPLAELAIAAFASLLNCF